MDTGFSGSRHRQMTQLVLSLRNRQNLDVPTILSELTAGAVHVLPPVEYAGITTSAHDAITTESSTGPFPCELDNIQRDCAEGPCVSTARGADVVWVDDIEHDLRWPEYTRRAVERTPIRSVLSLQLVNDTPGVSALHLYAETPYAFDVGLAETALVYAAYVAMAWQLVRRDEQFHRALQSRDIIGQAKGMIMERFEISDTQAFGLLKRLSQSSNTALAQVAVELVNAERRERRNSPSDRSHVQHL